MIPQNAAHWHLILNHVPLIGTLAGVCLYLAYLYLDSEDLKVVLPWWFLVTALVAIPVYMTGEPAADLVEDFRGVSDDAIDLHEDVANFAFFFQGMTGLTAAGVLMYRWSKGVWATWMIHIIAILALVTTSLMGYTASLGGKISHPETRPDFSPDEDEYEYESESRLPDEMK